MKYSIDYFIRKFKKIPEKKWHVGNYVDPDNKNACCALGHCGERYDAFFNSRPTRESLALEDLLGYNAAKISDGKHQGYPQLTPKQRILAALRDIKAK